MSINKKRYLTATLWLLIVVSSSWTVYQTFIARGGAKHVDLAPLREVSDIVKELQKDREPLVLQAALNTAGRYEGEGFFISYFSGCAIPWAPWNVHDAIVPNTIFPRDKIYSYFPKPFTHMIMTQNYLYQTDVLIADLGPITRHKSINFGYLYVIPARNHRLLKNIQYLPRGDVDRIFSIIRRDYPEAWEAATNNSLAIDLQYVTNRDESRERRGPKQLSANGKPDLIFKLNLESFSSSFPLSRVKIEDIELVQEFPKKIFSTRKGHHFLGVSLQKDKNWINNSDGSINPITLTKGVLWLFGCNDGINNKDTFYFVKIRTPNDISIESKPIYLFTSLQ